jgi:hypothetical protein
MVEEASSPIDYEKIICTFLASGGLRKVLAHLCNNASAQSADPISDVVHTMLTCPVQMVISEVRFASFFGGLCVMGDLI